jgi:hypothetical protein
MLADIQLLSPSQINRSGQLRLLARRLEVLLMPIRHFNEFPYQQFGWDWVGGGEADTGSKFLLWLRESVKDVLDAHWWIDSLIIGLIENNCLIRGGTSR